MVSSKAKGSPDKNAEERLGSDRNYFKLWRRFYEPLIMLKILGSTRGEHSPLHQQSPVHRFLDNLAYICDYDKGGLATSAISLETTPEQYRFWIASNCPKCSAKSVPFLRDCLQSVRTITDSSAYEKVSLQEIFIRSCVQFAKRRVKKEAAMLMTEIKKCAAFFSSAEGRFN
jgi:hypothetical protein